MSVDPTARRGNAGFNPRIAAVALHDVFMAAFSFELSVWLRYQTYGAPQQPFFLWHATIVFTAICALVFWRMGLYRGIWRYASMADLTAIAKAVTIAMLAFLPVMFAFDRLENFPRSALLINWPLLVLLLAGPRLIYRYLKDGNLSAVLQHDDDARVPVLLVGASDEAEGFIREMGRSRLAGYRPVGILDHKTTRIGRDIRGVRVLGGLDALEQVVGELAARGNRPQRLLLATSKLDGATVRGLLDAADELGLTLSRLPRLTEFRGSGSADDGPEVRPVDVEDLLRRPQRALDRHAMRRLISGRRVLVTGAGGTIGGELTRQIAALEPAKLVLMDNSEYALYRIGLELDERRPELPCQAVLGDVRDRARVEQVFTRERPELVFHAAAFKHVPMVEANPNEGLLTNVFGTANIADACRRHGTSVMVQVSTDKAVNPTSVMGASKRVAEMICQGLSLSDAPCRYVTVRFGNVLGSTGSVVPLFERQLARGGPLTVTHPDITRYFMTTREAVELVLQATAADLGSEAAGKIFVLDMGEPVRIEDLARQMIRLAGLRPDVDVAIEHTGLRPGEKLYEELFHDGEAPLPTPIDGVRLAAPRVIDHDEMTALVEQLAQAASARDTAAALALLHRLVPEFTPDAATAALQAGATQAAVAAGDAG